jgi:hypothetical protein
MSFSIREYVTQHVQNSGSAVGFNELTVNQIVAQAGNIALSPQGKLMTLREICDSVIGN